jgi:hypothetical protein
MRSLNLFASIEKLTSDEYNIISISNFESLEKIFCYLDMLSKNYIETLVLYDKNNNIDIRIFLSKNEVYDSLHNDLFICKETISQIQHMISNVIVQKAYVGYHYDISIRSLLNIETYVGFYLM